MNVGAVMLLATLRVFFAWGIVLATIGLLEGHNAAFVAGACGIGIGSAGWAHS